LSDHPERQLPKTDRCGVCDKLRPVCCSDGLDEAGEHTNPMCSACCETHNHVLPKPDDGAADPTAPERCDVLLTILDVLISRAATPVVHPRSKAVVGPCPLDDVVLSERLGDHVLICFANGQRARVSVAVEPAEGR